MAARDSIIDFVFVDQFDVLARHGHIIREDLRNSGQTMDEYIEVLGPTARAADLGEASFEVYQKAYNDFMGLNPDSCMIDRLEPVDPMHRLTDAMKQHGVPFAVFSNVSRGVFRRMEERRLRGGPRLTPNLPAQLVLQSCEIGLRKPEPAMYQYAANAALFLAGVRDPRRILVIDDTSHNVDGALEYGMNAFQFDVDRGDSHAQAIADLLDVDLPAA